MNRRKLLAGCALSLTIAGCLDDSTDDEPTDGETSSDDDGSNGNEDSENSDGDENDDEGDDGDYSTLYRIRVESPEGSAGDEDVCEFEELPADAQTEFMQAIDEVDFETADRARYEMEESPTLLDTDCYTQYIEFEGEYYWVEVEVESG